MEQKLYRRRKNSPEPRCWIVRCWKCEIIFNLPKSESYVRTLSSDIGKAKCPHCGNVLRRTNRNADLPIRTITREQANLA